MSTKHSLPFYLNIESLSGWLESISNLPPVNASSQLNQAINQLRKTDRESALIFPLLIKLTPTTLHLANALANQLKPGPQKKKTAKIAKLCLQLLRNLALAFHALLESQISVPQKLQAIYFSLQIIGQYFRLSNLFHELPSETLWNKSGELFAFAQNQGGLQENITTKIPEFRHQASIEQVVKRNLLFTIMAFRQQLASDNQTLFSFANEQSDLLKLTQEQTAASHFVWNYRKGIPFSISQNNRALQKNEIGLDISSLLPPLQSSLYADSISKQELERLQALFTGYEQQIKDTLPSAPIVFRLISGFKQVYDFLNKLEKLNRIHKASAQLPEQKQQTSFSLEPLEHEKSLSSGFSQAQGNAPQGQLNGGHNVKLLQSKDKRYVHIETKNLPLQVGDLVLLVNKKNAFIAGKILQISTLANTQSAIALVEKIIGNLSTQTLQSQQYSQSQGIIINQDSENPELLLDYDKYRTGTEFQLGKETVKLDSLLDYSLSFTRFRISR